MNTLFLFLIGLLGSPPQNPNAAALHAFFVFAPNGRDLPNSSDAFLEVEINGRRLDPGRRDLPQKAPIKAKGLDTVKVTIRSPGEPNRSSVFLTRLVDGETYIFRLNPCSRFEMMAKTLKDRNLSRFRFQVLGKGTRSLWFEGALSFETWKAEAGESASPWFDLAISANCLFASSFFRVKASEEDDAKSLATVSFMFLHGESLTLLYDRTRNRFQLSVDPEDKSQIVAPDRIRRELEYIATCFRDAVTELQREPGPKEALFSFLEEAEKAHRSAHRLTSDACNHHAWNTEAKTVSLTTGQEVSFERKEGSHSSMADGSSELTLSYRFFAKGAPQAAEIEVVLTVGADPLIR